MIDEIEDRFHAFAPNRLPVIAGSTVWMRKASRHAMGKAAVLKTPLPPFAALVA